ncbi:MAG: TadE family protein [Terracidiphilus sp.]
MRPQAWAQKFCRTIQGGRKLILRFPRFSDGIETGPNGKNQSEGGQAIIEIALALPFIAAFTFIMIELCLAFYSYCMISETAREGTRYAIVRGATCQTGSGGSCTASASSINTVVTHMGWPNFGNGTLSANTTYPDGNENPGSRVQVVVNYVYPYNIPFAPKGSLHMSSASVMYIVQ